MRPLRFNRLVTIERFIIEQEHVLQRSPLDVARVEGVTLADATLAGRPA